MSDRKPQDQTADELQLDRRRFISAAVSAAGVGVAGALATSAQAQNAPAPAAPPARGAGPLRGGGLYRVEAEVDDCEIEGKIPTDLNGSFYRVGPDFQYMPNPRTIPFDGEGHASMFRIKNGHVHFKSRYIRNDRYLAQAAAGRNLFPLYRNPYKDDPSVKGMSRSTANTHVINHKNLLLCLKEDSPPSALDLMTLETVDPNYTFGGKLPSKTFTAHPKVDSETGNIVAFGYEAKGFGSDDVSIFEINPAGDVVWNAWIKVPYVCMLHDFAVTQKYILFYVYPMAIDEPQMQGGGIHWSWDSAKPTYFGVLRRGGDGKDVRWFQGPNRSSIHMMGAFSDGNKVYYDCEMSDYNPFPFMPMRDGSKWDPVRGTSGMYRLSVDLSKKSPKDYKYEALYPELVGALPRQDDRYNTMPYRYAYLPASVSNSADPARRCYVRMDHQTRKTQIFNPGPNTTLAECVFAPRSKSAAEGDGYVMGVVTRLAERRSDLVILDAQHMDAEPVATVKLPIKVVDQIHGLWVPEWQLPSKA